MRGPPLRRFKKWRHCHAVAEKNAGETLGHHRLASGGAESNGRVLAGTAAAEIAPANDNGKFAVELPFLDVALRIERIRQPGQRVAAQLFICLLYTSDAA